MNELKKYFSASLLATAALLVGASPAWAQVAPPLGAASAFLVLGGAAVTCTDSAIAGDVGAGVAFTNTGCILTGAVPPATDPAVPAALLASASAYTALQSMPCGTTLSGTLAGQTLAPGVYCFTAAATLAGTLTLDGPSSGVWIFKVNGALTGTDNLVVMDGGGQACNVFWASNGATTMTRSAFKGNILAGNGAITVTGGTLAGRALASAAVTITGASVVGCDVQSGPVACKPKKHHHHDKDGHHGHDKDKHHGHDKDDHHGHDKDKHHGDDDDRGHKSDQSRYPFESKDTKGGKGGKK